MGNALQGIAAAVQFKDSANRGRFRLYDLELYAVEFTHASITECAAAGMERPQRAALHSAVSLKPELARVHAVDQAMNTE
ncbi:MAG: hypothetical protein DMG38_19610 [Acidobacteria bacterium]|nr:MAG: hypothetical protein DMG38_19610 [Acidobacteriota bacterium]